MADDLKQFLNQVKHSKDVTYYWGYGTGKRKEPLKPGEGVLRVFKSKAKVQRKEFQGLCDCSQFRQGSCWSAGEVIKFTGPGLDAGAVAKMKASVHSEVGSQFPFELATEAEAAVQARKGERAESEEPKSGAEAVAAPAAAAAAAPAPAAAPSPAADPASTAPTGVDAAYRTAVANLTDDLKKALHLGGPAALDIKQQYLQADAYFKQKEYKAALTQLVQLKRRIADALAAAPADAAAPAAPAGGPDLGLWTAARDDAVKHIRHIQSELLKTHDPKCIEAAKVLEDVPTRLGAPIDSRESVQALEQYVVGEELFALIDQEKFFGVATGLRNSLLTTLGVVKKQLAP